MARREQQRLGYREKSTSYKVAAAIRVLTTLTYVLESGGKKEGEKRKEERTAEALSPPVLFFPPWFILRRFPRLVRTHGPSVSEAN